MRELNIKTIKIKFINHDILWFMINKVIYIGVISDKFNANLHKTKILFVL